MLIDSKIVTCMGEDLRRCGHKVKVYPLVYTQVGCDGGGVLDNIIVNLDQIF